MVHPSGLARSYFLRAQSSCDRLHSRHVARIALRSTRGKSEPCDGLQVRLRVLLPRGAGSRNALRIALCSLSSCSCRVLVSAGRVDAFLESAVRNCALYSGRVGVRCGGRVGLPCSARASHSLLIVSCSGLRALHEFSRRSAGVFNAYSHAFPFLSTTKLGRNALHSDPEPCLLMKSNDRPSLPQVVVQSLDVPISGQPYNFNRHLRGVFLPTSILSYRKLRPSA